jgi:hypothetical protein
MSNGGAVWPCDACGLGAWHQPRTACVTSPQSTVLTSHPPWTGGPFITSACAQACTTAGSVWRRATSRVPACSGVGVARFDQSFLHIFELKSAPSGNKESCRSLIPLLLQRLHGVLLNRFRMNCMPTLSFQGKLLQRLHGVLLNRFRMNCMPTL